MSTYAPTISTFSVGSSWIGTYNGSYYSYSTPTTGYNDKSFSLASLPANAIIDSAVLTSDQGSAYTGIDDCFIYYDGTNYDFRSGSLNVKARVAAAVGNSSVSFRYRFKANGGAGGAGTHAASLEFADNKLTITYHLPVSEFSLNKTTVDAGQSITVTVTPESTEFKHRVTLRISDTYTTTYTIPANTSPATYTYTIPMVWCYEIPDSPSATCTAIVETMLESLVLGSRTQYFTMTVPASEKPTFTSVSYSGVEKYWNLFVQGKSKATIYIDNPAGKYGSSITGYSIKSTEITGTTNPFTTGYLQTAGDIVFTATITDSRGKTSDPQTCTVTVTPYAAPTITTSMVERTDSGGTLADEGAYCKATFSYTWAQIGSNSRSTYVDYKQKTASSYTNGSTELVESGGNTIVGTGSTFDPAKVYDIRIGISDYFNTTPKYVFATLQAGNYIMDFREGGTGIGLGTAATVDNAVVVNPAWESYYKDQTLDARFRKVADTVPVSGGGTGATTAAGARNALGLGNTSGALPIANGGTGQTTAAAVRNALGLGNTTDALPIANGGTGATTAAAALTALGIQSGTTGGLSCAASADTDFTVTFPTAYSSAPNVVFVVKTGTANKFQWRLKSVSTTGFTGTITNPATTSQTPTACWIAVG